MGLWDYGFLIPRFQLHSQLAALGFCSPARLGCNSEVLRSVSLSLHGSNSRADEVFTL